MNVFKVHRASSVLCIAALALGLAGCGRKGPLLPPPGVSEDQAAPVINPATSGTLDQNNSIAAQESKAPQFPGAEPAADSAISSNSPLQKPKRPFFLDPLL